VPLVDVATATRELRLSLETGEDADLERKLAAAEEQAIMFLGRNVYATPEDFTAAKAAAPDALAAAKTAYDTDIDAARAIADCDQRAYAERLAKDTYNAALEEWNRTMRGIISTDSIATAILLIAGSLWEHRGDEDNVVGIPPAAERFLWPFRIGIGV
jgi:hypothetical protein